MRSFCSGLLIVLSLLVVSPAHADDMDRLVQSLCDYTKANDRTNLRKKLKASDLQLRRVYGGMVCAADGDFNGGSLLRVAVAFGAADAAEFILSQVGSESLTSAEHDGKSLLQWAENLGADPAKKAVIDVLKAAG